MGQELRSEDAATRVRVSVENVDKVKIESGRYSVLDERGDAWACVKCGRLSTIERVARYCCATSFPCACGGRYGKSFVQCEACRMKDRVARYAKLPRRDWDGEKPLAIWNTDTYFWDAGSIDDYLVDCSDCGEDTRLEDLLLVFCKPVRPRPFDLHEYCEDSFADDSCELPDDYKEIEKVVNDWLDAMRPLSYIPGQVAPTLESLRRQA